MVIEHGFNERTFNDKDTRLRARKKNKHALRTLGGESELSRGRPRQAHGAGGGPPP